MPRLVLASASPARRALLTAAGIDALVVVSGVDEEALLAGARDLLGDLAPEDAVLLLAKAKAEAVARDIEGTDVEGTDAGGTDAGGTDAEGMDAEGMDVAGDDLEADDLLVLGCDSMLELDGEILGKPRDAQDARDRWRGMRGRTGVLHTGHWLVDARVGQHGSGGSLGAASSTKVHFAHVTDAEIDAYVATGEPLAVAGAFTIDGRGGAFVDGIEGDPHTVIGLSLPLLRRLLTAVGLSITHLWR